MRIAWHYTSYENWIKIERVGLIPYKFDWRFEFLQKYFGHDVYGIFVYDERQKGKSERGCVEWQRRTKQTDRVVLLKIHYDKEDEFLNVITNGLGVVTIWHDLTGFNGERYHVAAKARMLLRKIPPRNVELVRTWNVEKPATKLIPVLTLGGRDERKSISENHLHQDQSGILG